MRNLENKQHILRASRALQFMAGLMIFFYIYATIGVLAWLLFMKRLPDELTIAFWNTLPYEAIQLIAWFNLRIFFRRLHEGLVFDAPTVARLMTAGKWKMAGAVYSCLSSALLSAYVLPARVSPGPLGGAISGIEGHLTGLWTAVMIIFVAWLLREGQTLEEEQTLTV